jgi:hypothetical protein
MNRWAPLLAATATAAGSVARRSARCTRCGGGGGGADAAAAALLAAATGAAHGGRRSSTTAALPAPPPHPAAHSVRIHALSAAPRVDLRALTAAVTTGVDATTEELRGSRWYVADASSRDWLHVSVRPLHEDDGGGAAHSHHHHSQPHHHRASYVSISKRGSVVFTNADLADAIYALDVVEAVVAAAAAAGGSAGPAAAVDAAPPGDATHCQQHHHQQQLLRGASSSSLQQAAVAQPRSAAGVGGGGAGSRAAARLPVGPAAPIAAFTAPHHHHRTLDSLTVIVDPAFGSGGGSSPHTAATAATTGPVRLRRLDPASVATIAHVLAMSVTLQEAEAAVEPLADAAGALNDALSAGGRVSDLRPDLLHAMLAECSRITADLTLSGVSDVPPPGSPAWRGASGRGGGGGGGSGGGGGGSDHLLPGLHARLVDDFGITRRRDELEHRLAHVARLARGALGARRDGQLTRLDWLIVAILTLDVLLLLAKAARRKKMKRKAAAAAAAAAAGAVAATAAAGADGGVDAVTVTSTPAAAAVAPAAPVVDAGAAS